MSLCGQMLGWVLTVKFFFFQAEDGIRDLVRSRGLGDVYKRQVRAPARHRGRDLRQRQLSRRRAVAADRSTRRRDAVSYTHLTLPTSDLV